MTAALLARALLLTQACAAFRAPSVLPARRYAAAHAMHTMELREVEACLLLAHDNFPGEAPGTVMGEMSLQEMEDSLATSSQIYLNLDGTVSIGATDGPPPADVCGLWQCGEEEFQMTIQRSFTADNDVFGTGPKYTVTRLYRGMVNHDAPAGLKVVEGRIDLYQGDAGEDAEFTPASVDNAWSGEVRPGAGYELGFSAPIGYFTLDAVRGANRRGQSARERAGEWRNPCSHAHSLGRRFAMCFAG